MLIENGYHYRTLYVVVRLSELDLKTWILTFSFETTIENKSFPQFSKVIHNPVENSMEN